MIDISDPRNKIMPAFYVYQSVDFRYYLGKYTHLP